MRLLLDECVPTTLSREFQGFDVSTVANEGWQGRRNGDLLRAMAGAGFTHLVTVERNLSFQQNLAATNVAVIVMHAVTNRIVDLRPLVPQVIDALPTTAPGQVSRVGD